MWGRTCLRGSVWVPRTRHVEEGEQAGARRACSAALAGQRGWTSAGQRGWTSETELLRGFLFTDGACSVSCADRDEELSALL